MYEADTPAAALMVAISSTKSTLPELSSAMPVLEQPAVGTVLVSTTSSNVLKDPAKSQPAQSPGSTLKPRRFAVKFDPPCFCLEYEDALLQKRVRQVRS